MFSKTTRSYAGKWAKSYRDGWVEQGGRRARQGVAGKDTMKVVGRGEEIGRGRGGAETENRDKGEGAGLCSGDEGKKERV